MDAQETEVLRRLPSQLPPVPEDPDEQLPQLELDRVADLPIGWQMFGEDRNLDDAYVELSTRSMKVDERAAFMEAKRSELEDFFTAC